jgi:hypothetical protein
MNLAAAIAVCVMKHAMSVNNRKHAEIPALKPRPSDVDHALFDRLFDSRALRRIDCDRPTRRTAPAAMAAAVVSVEGEDPDGQRLTPRGNRLQQ